MAAREDLRDERGERGDFSRVLSELQASEQTPSLLWRLSRACNDLATYSPNLPDRERQKLLRTGLAYAERAVAEAPGEFKGFLWRGISRGRLSASLGGMEKLSGAYIIRDSFIRAVELSEWRDAESLHCLGQYYFALADLPPFDRNASSALGLSGTYDEALSLFLSAERLQADYPSNLLMAARCLARMGQHARALGYLRRVLSLRPASAEDMATLCDARVLQDQVELNLGSEDSKAAPSPLSCLLFVCCAQEAEPLQFLPTKPPSQTITSPEKRPAAAGSLVEAIQEMMSRCLVCMGQRKHTDDSQRLLTSQKTKTGDIVALDDGNSVQENGVRQLVANARELIINRVVLPARCKLEKAPQFVQPAIAERIVSARQNAAHSIGKAVRELKLRVRN